MEIETILPWQASLWHSLMQRKQQGQMPHALLFHGPDGIGKRHFAEQLAHSFLCTSSNDIAASELTGISCGHCKACHLLRAGSHPDLVWIQPEESGQAIKIDTIRDLVHSVNQTTLLGGYRVIIIHPASAMNTAAANALLKTLEEPSAKTLLILLSNQSLRLPATVISRCQRIFFNKPAQEVALEWLQADYQGEIAAELLLNLAEGAPLRAKAFLTNDMLKLRQDIYQGLLQLHRRQVGPLELAAIFSEKKKSKASAEEKNLEPLLNWLLLWLKDLLRLKMTNGEGNIINSDYRPALIELMTGIVPQTLLQYIEHVQLIYTRTLTLFNLNRQLVLEEIFIRWNHLCS